MSTQAGSLYHCALEAKPVPAVVPARAFVPLPASAFPFYSTEYKYHSPSLIRVMSTDPIRSTIEQDKEEHPHCSYSTLRSHFSSFLNGSSKAETLTKIIRVCEGEAPVEIFTHKNESDDSNGASGEVAMPHGFSHPQQLPPMSPLPGGGQGGGAGGGGGAEDILASLFGHVLEGVFQGFAGSNGRVDGGGGGGGFGSVFGNGFPFPMFPTDDSQQQQQQQQQPHRRIPRPPHSFPRGHHRADPRGGGGEDEVTEI